MLSWLAPIVSLLTSIVPTISADAGVASSTVGVLEQIVPIITTDAPQFISAVKNVIAATSSSGLITPAQIDALQVLDAQCDAAFERAAIAAGAAPDIPV